MRSVGPILAILCAFVSPQLSAQTPPSSPSSQPTANRNDVPPPEEDLDHPDFGGGPGPGGPGGFGGMMRQKTNLVKQFDKDGDGRLNQEERKAAREYLSKQSREVGGPQGGRHGGGHGGEQTPSTPGPKVTPAEVKNYPGAPLYDTDILRTFFLEFEKADWEKELETFKNTDVEVPAKLTVDGRVYSGVGVRFHGNSSFMMVSEGRKRSLSLSLDFTNDKQQLGGYHTLHLLNSNEDPSMMRPVLFSHIAREYMPSPKANWARVVINGESWGVYVNIEQINKDFFKEWFGTKKGARWKVPGSPNGQGGLGYLGENVSAYKAIYELKSKEDPKAWADLIKLCKVLNETPASQLEKALEPMLDIDGTLKFLALDNASVNGDGFWTRASDEYIYEDEKGHFHFFSQDINETFSAGGGPGGPGGPGGRGGPGGAGFPGGRGGFGPGMFLAPSFFKQADKNGDQMLSQEELIGLANQWFDKLDAQKLGRVTESQFAANFSALFPNAPRPMGAPGQGGGPGNFTPMGFIQTGLFKTLDANKDGSLTLKELQEVFGNWYAQWDADKSGSLNEEKVQEGLNKVLPKPNFAGRGGGPGRAGGPGGGMGGPPGMGAGGVDLDPLIAANNASIPLISKLLAVPSLRTRYLAYVRDIADKRFAASYVGPLLHQYQTLLSEDVKADTRKLDSYESFLNAIGEETVANKASGPTAGSLRNFFEQRRAYLLNYSASKPAGK